MNTKYSWIFIGLILLISVFWIDLGHSFAQDQEEVVVATQLFTIRTAGQGRNSGNSGGPACEVTAELRWYRRKLVKALYHWQACTDTPTIRWELASIRNGNGELTLTTAAGDSVVYQDTWNELASGDRLTLHTWINGAAQGDVVTIFRDLSPIWTKIHTRQDAAGACFQFTGHVDPWGVFTAGEHKYVLALSSADWTTPWLTGPNEPTVDWHVQFYRDAALTQLRTEYWFNHVPNPCHQAPPTICKSIDLSIANGNAIPDAGADVTVTIKSHNGLQYRIVDEQGTVVAGPGADPTFTFHAMPKVGYQAQVYGESKEWTTTGCQFAYNLIDRPVCHGVTALPALNEPILATGKTVQVTIDGENGSQYRVMNTQDGTIVAEPQASNVLSFHALPWIEYQAQIYSETYGWTTGGCTFKYIENATSQCIGVTQDSHPDLKIPAKGATVQVTVEAQNALQYRIFDVNHNHVIAGPSDQPAFSLAVMPHVDYRAQVVGEGGNWSNAGCNFTYVAEPPIPTFCAALELSLPNGATIPATGADVTVTVKAEHATQYRLVDRQGTVVAGPTVDNVFTFHALPAVVYQVQVANDADTWSQEGCEFSYDKPLAPVCTGVDWTPRRGTNDTDATIHAENANRYQIVRSDTGAVVAGPAATNILHFSLQPDILYQAEVSNDGALWVTAPSCKVIVKPIDPICTGVNLSIPTATLLPASGAAVAVDIKAEAATKYRIVNTQGEVMAAAAASTLHLHAMPNLRYQVQVANEQQDWVTSSTCAFAYQAQVDPQVLCTLKASHYGDPGGLSEIKAWVVGQTAPVAIEKVEVNWDNQGSVIYPTERQPGPWFTNTPFELNSRPEVYDVGFGRYKFEAWVYVAGIATPAYCADTGFAPDHDNVLPDPGPFAQANPEGKFNRGGVPSRLPTVGRLPFDGGNGPDKVELILWAFEKSGSGVNARITGIANEGKPLARLGMASVSNQVKFDGLPARDGIVYGFQIGEHGPWSPLFCPQADSNPTTITVYWAAGGQTWLSDASAFGDCWWLTVAAAVKGWVTVDETVATYNALQPIIDWHGHRNLVFSLAQSRETGLGPRMQDAVIGLQAHPWTGPVIPTSVPADFQQVVDGYRAAQAK